MSVQTPPEQVAEALMPDVPPRRLRQILIGATITALAVLLALVCIWLTVTRQQERDRATDVALQLCDQVNGVGQPCAVDPRTLPWAPGGTASAAAASGGPPALQPLPPRYAPTPASTTAAGGTGEETGTAQAAIPGPETGVTVIEITGGRLVLTYADGSRVDAGPVTGDLVSILRNEPTPTPSPPAARPASPEASAGSSSAPEDAETPPAGGEGTPTPIEPSGGPS